MRYCREEQTMAPWPWPASTWQKAEERSLCEVWHQEQCRRWQTALGSGQWPPCLSPIHFSLRRAPRLWDTTASGNGKSCEEGYICFVFSIGMLTLSNDFKATALNTTENFGHLFLLMCLFNWPSIVISAREHKLREGRKGACWTVLLLRYDSCQETVSRPDIRNVQISLRTTCGLGRSVIFTQTCRALLVKAVSLIFWIFLIWK